MAGKKMTKKRRSKPVPAVAEAPNEASVNRPKVKTGTAERRATTGPTRSSVKDRSGLWVALSGRMAQYGTVKVERPGQVIRQQFLKNDDLLLKHRYVRLLEEHEEIRECESCGLLFLGSITAGPFKLHLDFARHDSEQMDLDAGLKSQSAGGRSDESSANLDSDSGKEWDIEEEGAPPPTKLEDENPQGVRVSMG